MKVEALIRTLKNLLQVFYPADHVVMMMWIRGLKPK